MVNHAMRKKGWFTCNISIKDQIVSLSCPLHSTAQPNQFVTFPCLQSTSMYFAKFMITQFECPTSVFDFGMCNVLLYG